MNEGIWGSLNCETSDLSDRQDYKKKLNRTEVFFFKLFRGKRFKKCLDIKVSGVEEPMVWGETEGVTVEAIAIEQMVALVEFWSRIC